MQQSENAPLAGRVAVVTGASRGIGAAIARRLTRAGACVVIDYVSNDERARQCAQRIMDDCDAAGRVITCKADVTDAEQVRGMVSTTVTTFGGLDILVNNAFAHYSFDPRNRKTFGSIGWSDYTAQLEGCLKGAYNTCEAVLPQMRARRSGGAPFRRRGQAGGRIINISSNLVDSPIVPYHDYTAAKGALVGFTRSLAQEAGAWGVTVNAIAAGLTVGTDSSRATTEDMRERIIASTPLGRLATAEDIAGAVAMLAGDDAAFITGQTLHVDGGLVMR